MDYQEMNEARKEMIEKAIKAWEDKGMKRYDIAKELLRRANPLPAAIVWTPDDGIEVVNYDPHRFWKPFVVVLYTVEANWRANWSWRFEDILDVDRVPDDVDDVWKWADEKAREMGYEDFDDALCEILAEDVVDEVDKMEVGDLLW